jgi:hypothetical protein
MKAFSLPSAVERLISATNAGDAPGLLEAFDTDAVLIDFGRTFRGHEQIASWDRQENTGTQNRIHVTDVQVGEPLRIAVSVSGNGYNGDGVFEVLLRDGLISQLTIS